MQTGKQERNGVPGPTGTHNTASPGPDMTAAIAAAYGAITAAGAGGPIITASEGVVDWETGVAGHDEPGEA